jgi:hypothetical protein
MVMMLISYSTCILAVVHHILYIWFYCLKKVVHPFTYHPSSHALPTPLYQNISAPIAMSTFWPGLSAF